eukprot:8141976-Pyramimonas_sp.AAC.1
MAKYVISGFDRCSMLSTRTYPELSALRLKECCRRAVVEGALPVGVEYLCRTKLHAAVYQTAWYAYRMLVIVLSEHQITFHFVVGFARQCNRWHNRMPWLVPSPALPTCVADTLDLVESDIVQTYIG